MIYVIDSSNLMQCGDLYRDQFRLRHQEFIDRQGYDVKVYREMEFDEYDTPATTYLVCTNSDRKVLGVSRLIPTIVKCMLVEHWPHTLFNPKNIISPNTWEGTRFCVDKTLPPEIRRQVAQELCAAYLEFGLQNGVNRIIGLMQTYVLRSVFGRCGIQYSAIGDVTTIGRYAKVQAAEMEISLLQLQNMRRCTGLKNIIFQELTIYEKKGQKYAA
ncbi:MAG: acyl-homoserine-lactone synthase [Alphaproteobacteria bacterium]|nr:acyl-homoserine-lactone synthase [Alphaproteobacteria bacterium]